MLSQRSYAHRQFVAADSLMSYGIDNAAVFRQDGMYAGRILKGAKPADLPVQKSTELSWRST
jgi:putative tryptophan/tyrosine transport system substrate-binding protein